MRSFILRKNGHYGSEAWVLYEADRRHGERARIAGLKGWRLSVVLPHIRKAVQLSETRIRVENVRPGNASFHLHEEDGVRLALTFRGVRNLQKLERAEKLCRGVYSMSREEAYYWYSRTSNRETSSGIRALRTLIS
jgi:hypothetical protein